MIKMKSSIISLLFFITISLSIQAQRQSERLIQGWEYVKGVLGGVYEALRTGKEAMLPVWTNIEMPHCFNQFDAVDPDVPYYQGPGWYVIWK
jgi:beta-galactosidase